MWAFIGLVTLCMCLLLYSACADLRNFLKYGKLDCMGFGSRGLHLHFSLVTCTLKWFAYYCFYFVNMAFCNHSIIYDNILMCAAITVCVGVHLVPVVYRTEWSVPFCRPLEGSLRTTLGDLHVFALDCSLGVYCKRTGKRGFWESLST